MKEMKRTMLRLFFTLEVIIFTGVYFFGAHGMSHVWRLKKEINGIQQDIATLENEVQTMHNKIARWKSHPYEQEKLAREQLQMARPGEKIYYIT